MKRRLSRASGRVFYGWWIVIIGCVQDAVKGGTFNTGFTLYFLPILTELHLSPAATSLPFSLAKLESAIEGPLVGSMPAAVLTGWIYDQTQSYTYALIGFIICYAVAGLILWRLPHPKRPARLTARA